MIAREAIMRLISALVFTFLFASWISAQSEARTMVKFIGRNIVFPVITYQRDCPLKIEKFLVVENNKGRYETEYAVRNIGRKSIKAYRIARWFSDDTGFLGYGPLPPGNKLIRPGSVVDTTRGLQIVFDTNASRS